MNTSSIYVEGDMGRGQVRMGAATTTRIPLRDAERAYRRLYMDYPSNCRGRLSEWPRGALEWLREYMGRMWSR